MSINLLAEAFPAGEFLAEELAERNWTQADFAEIIGRPPQFVSEIISGKKEITRESAAQIGAALGTSAEMWLNLQDSYHLWRQSQDSQSQKKLDEVRLRSRMKEIAPVTVLVRRGYIKSIQIHEQAEELRKLYKMEKLTDTPSQQIAARRSNHRDQLSPTQLAWVACAQAQAETKKTAQFTSEGLEKLAPKLSQLVSDAGTFNRLPMLFADCGVALVYVESFPSSKIDGCSFILENGKPAIALSGRGKRLDKVLFTLLHEVAHIVLDHLVERELILDNGDDSLHDLGPEHDADQLASSWVLPQELPELPLSIRSDWVERISEANRVHSIVIVGRLQKLGVLDWRSVLGRDAPTVEAQLSLW